MRAPPPYRIVARAVAVLAAVGLCREAFFHLVSEPVWRLPEVARAPRSDARYAQVAALLPAQGRVGYVSDEPVDALPGTDAHEEGTKLYQQALYALAPRVLVYPGEREAVVLANLVRPEKLQEVAAAGRLEVVAVLPGGVAVLRPRAR